jgi:large subunit ribosomal protein L35
MPKLKTHKGAKKRLHFTGTGKIMRVKQGKSHFRRNKSKASKGLFDETIPLNKADAQRIKRVLPYH